MTMLTRDLSYLEEEHICPHCKQKMSCCEAPAVHVGDGLGWGSDVLFICLNDGCSLFLKGWEHVEEQYGHHASYRYMELPGSKESNLMMVGNKDAFKASVIDPKALQAQNERYRKEKQAVKELDTAVQKKNIQPALALVLDEGAAKPQRERALIIMEQISDTAVIDPVRNHTFRDTSLELKANMVCSNILKANFKKECPHCCEIIKLKAKKCMHCQSDVE